jgi:hypothetical protein
MYSVYFTRENRKKFAIFPLILKYIYTVYSYGTLDCRRDVKGLFSSLNESWASLIATKVQTLNVMSIESMTVLIHLMDVYICSYIFVIKCHLCISEKLCFYTAYIAVILLLNWFMHACMEATICMSQKGQRRHDMHVYCPLGIGIESRGRGFFTFTWEFLYTLLPIGLLILLKFSIKTMNHSKTKINHRQFYCFGFI